MNMLFVEKTLKVLPEVFTKEQFKRKYERLTCQYLGRHNIDEMFKRFNIESCGHSSEKASCGWRTVASYSIQK